MEKIVVDDGYVIGTLEHLRLLYLCAKQKEENHICEYRWTLGVKVIQDLDLVNIQRIWNDGTRADDCPLIEIKENEDA